MAEMGETKWLNGQYVRVNGGSTETIGRHRHLFQVTWLPVPPPPVGHRERTMDARAWDDLPDTQEEEHERLEARVAHLEEQLMDLQDRLAGRGDG